MSYRRTKRVIEAKHRVRQLGSVWLWTGARRIQVKDIIAMAEDLIAAGAPRDQKVKFDLDSNQPDMVVEWEDRS